MADAGADRIVLAMPPVTDIEQAKEHAFVLRPTTFAKLVTLDASDRLALADVVHHYAAAVDDRRFDDAAELLTADLELRLPDPHSPSSPTVCTPDAPQSAPHLKR